MTGQPRGQPTAGDAQRPPFARLLLHYRSIYGLSQKEVVRRLIDVDHPISKSAYSYYESGDRLPQDPSICGEVPKVFGDTVLREQAMTEALVTAWLIQTFAPCLQSANCVLSKAGVECVDLDLTLPEDDD